VAEWGLALLLAIGNALLLCAKLALVLVPVMVAFEFAKGAAVFRARESRFSRVLAPFGISPASAAVLLAGLAFGIVYGVGALVALTREHRIPRREITTVSLFLCLCHAMVEDPLLFVVVGAHWVYLIAPRLVLAVLAVFLLECWRRRRAAA
jgi:hypothetical protein